MFISLQKVFKCSLSLGALVLLSGYQNCTGKLTFQSLENSAASTSASLSAPASGPALVPTDAREITFPADVAAWGWLDVTKNGAAIATPAANIPSLGTAYPYAYKAPLQAPVGGVGCVDAIPNDKTQAARNTAAIQCRLNYLGYTYSSTVANSGSLYFPAGTYYINGTLSLTAGFWSHNSSNGAVYQTFGHTRSLIHISGEDPNTTKIVWVGSCAPAANVSVNNVTKYNDIFYINGIHSFTLERLTLDGGKDADGKTNCAGSGIDMVSKPSNISGVAINEMFIQNFKEVGIVGDRPNMTADELTVGMTPSGKSFLPYSEADTTGMVSEVTITNAHFADIDYACIMPNAYNAVDWWIRDSSFSNCNMGITQSTGGVGWNFTGQPQLAPLPWGDNGGGGFQVANSYFENSRTVDIFGGQVAAARNNFSIASRAPFYEGGSALLQGNTVIASAGVIPVVSVGGTAGMGLDELVLLQNQFSTQNNAPAVLVWTILWEQIFPKTFLQGANPTVGNLWNESYSNVVSVGNQFTSPEPFANVSLSNNKLIWAPSPGWKPSSQSALQCGPVGGLSSMIDDRTYCNLPGANFSPTFNLFTTGDALGAKVSLATPVMAPIRPIVPRSSIVMTSTTVSPAAAPSAGVCPPQLSSAFTQTAAQTNSCAIQSALNTLAKKQASCATADYYCKDRWGILFLPFGNFPIATTIVVPSTVQLQIVGTGATGLYWYWYTLGTPPLANVASTAIFQLAAPAHVAMRDLNLFGEPNVNQPNPLGDALIAEVSDISTSRVFADTVRGTGGLSVNGIGNAAFQMRSFSNGESTATNQIIGNNAQNQGYFGYFMGNPTNLNVGGGANLMIQDTWYEGDDSSYVSCAAGDSANVTVESSMVSMAGWHANANTISSKTTFNLSNCITKTAVIESSVTRQVCFDKGAIVAASENAPAFPAETGCIAPAPNLILPASTTPKTQVLFLSDTTANSTYAAANGDTTGGIVPMGTALAAPLDQGYLYEEPGSHAQVSNLLGSFIQNATYLPPATKAVPLPTPSRARAVLPAKNTGIFDASFVQLMLTQALDSRMASPSRLVVPITDPVSTDIRLERIWMRGNKLDLQFVPAKAATK